MAHFVDSSIAAALKSSSFDKQYAYHFIMGGTSKSNCKVVAFDTKANLTLSDKAINDVFKKELGIAAGYKYRGTIQGVPDKCTIKIPQARENDILPTDANLKSLLGFSKVPQILDSITAETLEAGKEALKSTAPDTTEVLDSTAKENVKKIKKVHYVFSKLNDELYSNFDKIKPGDDNYAASVEVKAVLDKAYKTDFLFNLGKIIKEGATKTEVANSAKEALKIFEDNKADIKKAYIASQETNEANVFGTSIADMKTTLSNLSGLIE